jgi:simple sugar transport system ATP-binding protein
MTTISLSGISKRFGDVQALDDVSLTISAGEVHALLGENGAGKSTLLGILSGLVRPDSGEILIDGQPALLESPADALHAGIATVYQHFTLVPPLTVAENLQLAVSGTRRIERDELRAHLRQQGVAVALGRTVESLTVGQRQGLEIAKALLHAPRVLLLDEPTSVLAGPEISRLLHTIRAIAGRGTAVVLVTHKLDEALEIADRVTVLRGGEVSGEIALTGIPVVDRYALTYRLVGMMFERRVVPDPGIHRLAMPTESRQVIARLTGISARDERGAPALRNLSLNLASGQVLGIAGIDGNGQRELAEVLAGERHVDSGSLQVGDTPMTNEGARAMIEAGVAVVTAERLLVGCVPGTSLELNLALKHLASPLFANGMRLDRLAVRRFADELIDRYEIEPPDPERPITQLSGGNIQRALLARELAFEPKVLVLHEPTAGLDLATTESMLARVHEAAEAGTAVLLISSDLDELLAHCDRIAVIYRGRIAAQFAGPAFDRDAIERVMVVSHEEVA